MPRYRISIKCTRSKRRPQTVNCRVTIFSLPLPKKLDKFLHEVKETKCTLRRPAKQKIKQTKSRSKIVRCKKGGKKNEAQRIVLLS